MEDFEKLGAFYLGKVYDIDKDRATEELVLYDSKDLTTHAVIIGMTGSGKTGLGIGLLEEAAIDKIPVIAIDPKGDLGNILLTFPRLAPADFEPWVNAQDAANQGRTVAEYARDQAALWAKGLKQWGQDAERIGRLRDTVDMAIYTPGSSAGLPISVLRSFNAPPQYIREDKDLFRERIGATATSILALLDLDADPLTSRDHILLSNILQHTWDQGGDLDIGGLIAAIQQPAMERVGVMTLDAFYPPKERYALAMRFNNLLAAPGFDVWMEGEALDAAKLLYTQSGQPRVSVVSIAHLSDSERMFFVTMLLNEIVSWMRRQPGTGSLRAILYMDEIFGYLPPTANPPSKALFLTLLKQARAYGLGLALATQNPVDLDYKALSNAGTWFIGRLQTERDKSRVMEGLEGAASENFDRQRMERILAGLGKRRFLLHSVHENRPVVFSTRWVLSYLAGPFTRDQIKTLVSSSRTTAAADEVAPPLPKQPASSSTVQRPMLPPETPAYYLPLTRPQPAGATLIYHPYLLGAASVVYNSAKFDVHAQRVLTALTEIGDAPVPVDWQHAEIVPVRAEDVEKEAHEEAAYAEPAAAAADPRSYARWSKDFARWIRNHRTLELFKSPTFKAVSEVGESEGEFRARLQLLAHEKRDMQIGKLRRKYEAKVSRLEQRLLRAEQRLATEQEQATQSKVDTAIALGTAVLGAFLGRKRVTATSTRQVGTAARRAGRIGKQAGDVGRAREIVTSVKQQLEELSEEFDEEVANIESAMDAQSEELETIAIRAQSSDIRIELFGIAWAPYYQQSGGELTAAWS